jgi:glycosyltransferase involved in cell wall biosynthesis
MARQPTERDLRLEGALDQAATVGPTALWCVEDSPTMADRLRVALTLEQCWHAVPGGTARSALESVRALLQWTGLDLVGVAARHNQPPPAAWTPKVEVRMLPLPRHALYESWHYLRQPKVQRATGDVDVIHATGVAVPPKSAPLVVTVHDLAFLHEPSHFTRHGLRFFKRALALTLRDADLVVVPSDATRDDCLANGFEASRVRVVPWGIDVAPAKADDVDAARRRYGLNRPYLLWTGTIEPRKNLPTLIRAYARLDPEADLVLVGPQGWNENLDRLIAPVRSRVKVLGFVTPDELRSLYAGAEVFCFPSLREGFGLPVLEAMAEGTAVVTSAGTSTAEIGGDAVELVDPTDEQALAGAIGGLLADRERAAALGDAGVRRAQAFTWERTARLLERTYREVAA